MDEQTSYMASAPPPAVGSGIPGPGRPSKAKVIVPVVIGVLVVAVLAGGAFFGGKSYQKNQDDSALSGKLADERTSALAYAAKRSDVVLQGTVASVAGQKVTLTTAAGKSLVFSLATPHIKIATVTAGTFASILPGEKIKVVENRNGTTGALQEVFVYLGQ